MTVLGPFADQEIRTTIHTVAPPTQPLNLQKDTARPQIHLW